MKFAPSLITLTALVASSPGSLPAQSAERVSPEWTDAIDLLIEGQAWSGDDLAHPYHRLPARAQGAVREAVWDLGRQSAGLSVRFVTDSPQVSVEWTVTHEFRMDHMTNMGISGVDLYARDGDRWRWVGSGRVRDPLTNRATLVSNAPPGEHDYRLYLPLYTGTESVRIGIVPGHAVVAPPVQDRRPIVFYGTSITQGGCASRPGMAYPSILGRHLGWPVVNLGFSGNGRMDPEVGELLAGIDAALFVLDCGANMTAEWARERTVPFIRALRAARPDTPILVIEDAQSQSLWFSAAGRESNDEKNAIVREALATLRAEGVENLHHREFTGLIGDDGEGTVDGIHFTDLGFLRMAESLAPVIEEILSE